MALILAISSHVAFGTVGLGSMVPALHWLGHEVIALPTVTLSNHPGYPRFAGEAVPPAQMTAMVEALEANGWLAETAAVITGYLPTPAHVAAARAAVERVRAANGDALFLCDPVFGDEAGPYLPEETAIAIRDTLLPLAHIITPNRFELSWLAGRPVGTPAEARSAAEALAIPTVLATSIPASDNRLANVLTTDGGTIACYVRHQPITPHGTGDLLAAMYLGNRLNGASAVEALGASVAAVDTSVAASTGRRELPLAGMGALWADATALPTVPV